MFNKRYFQTIILALAILISSVSIAFCLDDGFTAAEKIAGRYFTVSYQPGVDFSSLLEQLDIGPSDRLLAGKSANTKLPPKEELAEMLDTLFLRVCNILDMRLYNKFQGQIKICKSDGQLRQVYFNFFSQQLNSNYPFYIHHYKTIYVSAENFTSAVMGHEIAHAVISNYFVVLPPVKIQEVLAGYVEYQLRKNQGIEASFK